MPSCDEMLRVEELAQLYTDRYEELAQATPVYGRCLASRVDTETARMPAPERRRFVRLRALARAYMAALAEIALARARLDYPPQKQTSEERAAATASAEQLAWNILKVRAGGKLSGKAGATSSTYEAEARANLRKPPAAPDAARRAVKALDGMRPLLKDLPEKERWAAMKWSAEAAAQYLPEP
jgi:hypothetical protein